MSVEIVSTDSKIMNIINSGFGNKYNIKTKLKDIEEIPIDDFNELKKKIFSGNALIRQAPMSTSSVAFNLVASPTEQFFFTFSTILSYLIPLIGIILTIVYSWLFLILIAFLFVGLRIGKNIYLSAIFNNAANSELAFCFLFCGSYITIELPGYGILYRNQEIGGSKPTKLQSYHDSFYDDIPHELIPQYQEYFEWLTEYLDVENKIDPYDNKTKLNYDTAMEEYSGVKNDGVSLILLMTMVEQYVMADQLMRQLKKHDWVNCVMNREQSDYFPDGAHAHASLQIALKYIENPEDYEDDY